MSGFVRDVTESVPELNLGCPPRQQVNFGIAVSPASERFCSVAALLAAAAAAPRSRWR